MTDEDTLFQAKVLVDAARLELLGHNMLQGTVHSFHAAVQYSVEFNGDPSAGARNKSFTSQFHSIRRFSSLWAQIEVSLSSSSQKEGERHKKVELEDTEGRALDAM